MSDLTDPEKAFDDKRPVSKRLGIKHLSEKEFTKQLYNWGIWVGSDKREVSRATGVTIHPLAALIERRRQETGEKTEARAIMNSFNESIMERIDALITEGLVRNHDFRRPGAIRFIHAQILRAEFSSSSRFKKKRARQVKKYDGTHVSVRYYSDQLPIAVDRLRGMYNSPDLFVA